ncbi:unnamed protein product [Lymnaea stagnalis]|uniref:Uncharacterized protein n=1 Tax=Lymnaea stagnalis TaxID=6523 RepID=A0AAV2HT76_LYMST
MATQSAMLINLPKLVVDWFSGERGHAWMNGDLNAPNQSVDVTWTQISPITKLANGVTRKVELKYADHQQEIYSELGLVQNVKKAQRVTLGDVVMTGLAQPIRLPLSKLPPEVRKMFGDELIIRDKVSWETNSEQEAPELNSEPQNNGRASGGSRVAMVTTTESTCTYHFECQIILENAVSIQASQKSVDRRYTADIEDIIDILEEMKCTFPKELEKLHVFRNAYTPRHRSRPSFVTWILTGECEFRWSSQPVVEWA